MKPLQTRASSVPLESEGRHIYGIAVPYGERIAIWDAEYGFAIEEMRPGVFTRSLRERAHKIRLLDHHAQRAMPLGKLVGHDDRLDGLFTEFEMAKTRAGDEALELVRSGMIDAFSVGFSPLKTDKIGRDTKKKLPVIARVSAVWLETSLVNFPAYSKAEIQGTRSGRNVADDLNRLRKIYE